MEGNNLVRQVSEIGGLRLSHNDRDAVLLALRLYGFVDSYAAVHSDAFSWPGGVRTTYILMGKQPRTQPGARPVGLTLVSIPEKQPQRERVKCIRVLFRHLKRELGWDLSDLVKSIERFLLFEPIARVEDGRLIRAIKKGELT